MEAEEDRGDGETEGAGEEEGRRGDDVSMDGVLECIGEVKTAQEADDDKEGIAEKEPSCREEGLNGLTTRRRGLTASGCEGGGTRGEEVAERDRLVLVGVAE